MGLNLCWIQIPGMLSVWSETKAWNPCCINLRDQTLLSARAPPGSVQPGINSCVPAVSYGHRIQRWSCDVAPRQLYCCCGVFCLFQSPSQVLNGSPAAPQCSGLTGQAPAPQIPCFPAYSRLGLLHIGLQRLLKAPGRGRR